MVRLSLSFLVTVVFLFSPQIIVAKSALAGSNPPKAPVKQIDVFCQKFDKACADTCLKNKTGPITISFACSKVSRQLRSPSSHALSSHLLFISYLETSNRFHQKIKFTTSDVVVMGRRRLRVSSSCFPSFLLPSLKPLLSIL